MTKGMSKWWIVTCWWAGTALAALGQPATPEREIDLETARQNLFLREFFSSVAREQTGLPPEEDPGESHPKTGRRVETLEDKFLERIVDQWIDRYLGQVHGELKLLQRSWSAARAARGRALSSEGTGDPKARLEWKAGLREVEQHSRALHALLSRVLVGFKSASGYRADLGPDPQATAFEHPMKLIDETFSKVETSIWDGFLAPTHTVNLKELEEDSVLRLLRRLEKLSRAIYDRL